MYGVGLMVGFHAQGTKIGLLWLNTIVSVFNG
jgi:hypothetical protein